MKENSSIVSPFFSIIIPSYNREDFIVETLESVRNQTFSNWECVIVDDDSTDSSFKTVSEYIKKDNRFSLYKRSQEYRKGACGSRNYGVELSKGKYLKWLDSDDLLGSEILEYEYNTINKSCCDLTVCAWQYFDKNNTIYPIRDRLVKSNIADGFEILKFIGNTARFNPTGVYSLKKDFLIKSGAWNEYLPINNDGEFFFRVLVNVKNISAIDHLGFLYRKDSTNQLSKDSSKFLILVKNWKYIEAYANAMNLDLMGYISYGKWNSFNNLLSIKDYKTIWKERKFYSTIMNSSRMLKIILFNKFKQKKSGL